VDKLYLKSCDQDSVCCIRLQINIPVFSDTALTTCKNVKPHHRILQCKAIQHVGGRDIAFKWSSLLENLKSGVRDEGDTAQHST